MTKPTAHSSSRAKGKGPSCPSCLQPLPPAAIGEESAPRTQRWPHFPFCSPRCRDVDLHGWMTNSFRIPGEYVDPDDPEVRGLPTTDDL